MKKKLALLMVAVLLLLNLSGLTADAADVRIFSVEAARKYCSAWNDYFVSFGKNIACDYLMTDDEKYVDRFTIGYNSGYETVHYNSEIIPENSSLYFVRDELYDTFSFCVFSKVSKPTLEKVTIYTESKVYSDIKVICSYDPNDMWAITIPGSDVLELFAEDYITVRLTLDGKSEILDISISETQLIYEMVNWLIKAHLYTDSTFENYMSSEYLPTVNYSSDDSSNSVQEEGYSFQEDYDALDKTAKSVFLTATEMDIDGDSYLTTGSGFVAFDEHLFITNQHVINGASYLVIQDDDDNVYYLDKVVVSDAAKDIAILLFPEGNNYDSLELDSSSELKRGQPVVTIGSPESFRNTVAFGNISAFPVIDGVDYIQFTAPISHGSSGGCLFNNQGKVIGITSARNDTGSNIGLAIPIHKLEELYNKWNKKDYELLGTEKSWNIADYSKQETDENSTRENQNDSLPIETEKPTTKQGSTLGGMGEKMNQGAEDSAQEGSFFGGMGEKMNQGAEDSAQKGSLFGGMGEKMKQETEEPFPGTEQSTKKNGTSFGEFSEIGEKILQRNK